MEHVLFYFRHFPSVRWVRFDSVGNRPRGSGSAAEKRWSVAEVDHSDCWRVSSE